MMTINTDIKTYNLSKTTAIPQDEGTVQGAGKKGTFELTEADVNDVGKSKENVNGGEMAGMAPPKNGAGKAQDAAKVTAMINWDEGNFIPSDLLLALFEANKKMRAANLDARNTELNMQVNSLMGQAKDIKDAADKTYTASLIQGWVSVGSGVVSGVTSSVGMVKSYGASKDLKEFKTTTEMRKDYKNLSKNTAHEESYRSDFKSMSSDAKANLNVISKKIDQSTNVTQASSAAGTAIGSMAGGASAVAAAGQTKEASELEAEGKKKEAEATRMAAELQKTNEYAQNAKEQLKATLDLIQAIANAEKSVSDSVNKNMV